MSKDTESKKKYGVRRLINKILQAIAKSSFLSGYMRARIQKLRGVHFDNVGTVFLGEDIIIDGICPSNVSIGDRCIITSGTKILTHFLDTESLSDHADYHFRFYVGKVVIENDVFIGMNCVIAKPVTIGKGAIIGANVVVTKDVPAGAVMVGSSAVNIKNFG
ncbi:MAG: transferase [Flavobacteriales bacterium]|nr:transferase [Flavobacteriales bacterium]|tara:strand:- start:2640 stop:3125 length:486 start_codon:yes stop_codon:yes gene_type:complete